MKSNIDPDIAYWASLCEDTSEAEAKKNEGCMNEAYETPYAYDVKEGAPQIVTVKDLKNALSNFKDNDVISILGEGDREFDIKCVWNSNMEYEMTGNDAPDNMCYIRID